MKGIILYQSKYGTTKKYATWLAEKTGFSLLETRAATPEALEVCDTIVLGGGVYASTLAGLSFLKKNIASLQGKRILVFFVGASPYDEADFRALVQRNMTDELRGIPCFYCRGAWDMERMNWIDRALCRMLRKAVAKKKPEDLAGWEKAFADAGASRGDWTDPSSLAPILHALEG